MFSKNLIDNFLQALGLLVLHFFLKKNILHDLNPYFIASFQRTMPVIVCFYHLIEQPYNLTLLDVEQTYTIRFLFAQCFYDQKHTWKREPTCAFNIDFRMLYQIFQERIDCALRNRLMLEQHLY